MDFHTLSRKDLQALCKKNKIPANITNLAMAEALAALPLVEGVEDFLNAEESKVLESPKKEEIICSENPRTALRTSTRRKTVKEEPKTSQTLTRTRRGTRSKCEEEPDQENKDQNAAITSALPSGRRRTAAASACKKVDFQINIEMEDKLDQEKNDVPETPAVLNSQKRVATASARRKTEARNNETTEQRMTRRSVRLLEKNMESLSLMEERKTEPIAVQLSFDEMPNGAGFEEEPIKETMPEKIVDSDSKSVVELKVSTEVNDLELEIDDQEKDETMDEPEMHSEISTSAENLLNEKSSDDEISKNMNEHKTDEPTNNLDDMKNCIQEDAPEIFADNAAEFSSVSVDVTEVDNLSSVDISGTKVSKPEDTIGGTVESVTKVDSALTDKREAVDEDDEKDLEITSVQGNVDVMMKSMEDENDITVDPSATRMGNDKLVLSPRLDENPSTEVAEDLSENLVDVKIQFLMDKAPEDVNDSLDSQTKMLEKSDCDLVDVSVTTIGEGFTISSGQSSLAPFAPDQMAGQFPRPSVVPTKSPVKELTAKLRIDNIDTAEEEETMVQKACQFPRPVVTEEEKYLMSLRQLKKMFKKKLQLGHGQKKMEDKSNSNKEVRIALQQLPENRMVLEE